MQHALLLKVPVQWRQGHVEEFAVLEMLILLLVLACVYAYKHVC